MSTVDPEVQAEQREVISSVAGDLYDSYEEKLMDFGHEVEAAGAEVVDDEIHAERTSKFMAPEEVPYDLGYLVTLADQTSTTLRDAVDAAIVDPKRGGREFVGTQVLDSPYIGDSGRAVVEYFRGTEGWSAEISYRESGEIMEPESEQVRRFVSEVENALGCTAAEPEIIGW